MKAYLLTPLAKADIFHVWTYIAADNEDAAFASTLFIHPVSALPCPGPRSTKAKGPLCHVDFEQNCPFCLKAAQPGKPSFS